jgi:hypothetical protein
LPQTPVFVQRYNWPFNLARARQLPGRFAVDPERRRLSAQNSMSELVCSWKRDSTSVQSVIHPEVGGTTKKFTIIISLAYRLGRAIWRCAP